MEQLTWDRHGSLGVENARRNLNLLDKGQSIAALRGQSLGKSKSAVIIAAGPSVKRQDPLKLVREHDYDGVVIATESALAYCLRNEVVPDLTISLDPHATRIVRWFGDPALSEDSLRADDYFRRQDMDEAFANEMAMNQELLDLFDKYGDQIKIALSTSASEAVTSRVLDIGMDIYWWNPMYDDPDEDGGITQELQCLNRLPAINAGGNVGSAAWMMASAVLELPKVALTGMDFSYYADTPYENTQYYREALDLVGEENLDSIYIKVFNPFTETWFYSDPAYFWYREALLDMLSVSECETFNCTEGGIVFGDNIQFVPLANFLTEQV